MGNQKLKLLWLFFFLAFAAVSCWATVESLVLSLNQIPKWVFWIAVVGIYILTSILTKVIVDCFNPDVPMDRRNAKLFGSILGIMLLWLCFSMPTNTHTFFYRKMGKDVALKELYFLNTELFKLTDENLYKEYYNKQWEDYVTKVKSLQRDFEAQVNNPQQLGHGEKAEEILQQIESTLGLSKGTLQRLNMVGANSIKQRTIIKKYYDNHINAQLEIQRKEHVNNLESQLKGFRQEAKKVSKIKGDVSTTIDELNDATLDQNRVLDKATKVAQNSRAMLDAKYGYLIVDPAYKTQKVYSLDRLRSIFKVWQDYLGGEFKGKNYGLIYWILLSVIVDLAAFLFFNLAFKNEE